jgi:hypothetical protein
MVTLLPAVPTADLHRAPTGRERIVLFSAFGLGLGLTIDPDALKRYSRGEMVL